MNLHQTQYLNSFRQHLPSLEEKAKSSIYNFESFLSLNDPPNITTLDLASLSASNFLNANPKFLGLMQMLRNWNKKVDDYNKEKGNVLKKEHYRIQIFANIHSQLMILLREVNVTEDKIIQNQMLNKIENWFYRETGKSKMKPTFANENIVYMGSSKNNEESQADLIKPMHDNFLEESNEKLKGFTRRVPSKEPNKEKFGTKVQQNSIKSTHLYEKNISSKEEQSANLQNNFRKSIFCSLSKTKINPISFSEIKMENLWLKQRNKEIRARREDQEIINFMKEWSKSKGRLQENITQRGEGNQFGSEFNNLKNDPKNEITIDLEDEDMILKEYPLVENPENEYTRFDNGFNLKNVRVLNEPEEIKGGTEIYRDNNKEDYVADFFKDETNIIKTKEEKGEKSSINDNLKYTTPNKPAKNNNNKSNKTNNANYSATDSNFAKKASSSQASMSTTAGRASVFKSNEYPTLMESAKKNKRNLIKPISTARFFDLKYSKTQKNNKLIPNNSNVPIIKLRGVELEENKSEKMFPITITNPFKENNDIIKRPNTVPIPFFRDTKNLEMEINKSKIESIRKNEAHYLSIDLSQNKNEHTINGNLSKHNASLSVYTRPWSENVRQRKFSSLLGSNTSPLKVYQEQLEEVENIKKSFAKWGLACPVKNMENALITPWINLENGKIAEPGIGLIANPFNKPEKKKKKKRVAKSARK